MDELKEILGKTEKAYIFGTGEVGRRIFRIIESLGEEGRILGFLISNNKYDSESISDKSVYCIDDGCVDTEAVVLMTVSESYHPEAYEIVKKRGFNSVVSVMKYHNEDISSSFSDITVEEISEKCIDHSVDQTLTDEQLNIRKEIISSYFSSEHTFGDGIFYQSLPQLGIKGWRPTDERIKEYDLDRYLSKETRVLDIGCNLGFIDIAISDGVLSVLGIEYSKSLVDIGCLASKALKRDNVRLVCSDYNEWNKSNSDCFDLILSFAVHIWLDIQPSEYAKQCNSRLNRGGYLIFESQDLSGDKMFDTFVSEFIKTGLRIVDDGLIMDDGETRRRFVVFIK